MKKVISTMAFVALFSISMNAQQQETKQEAKQKSKEVAKTEKTPAKKECSKDEKKGSSCCMAKKEAKV